MSTDDENGSGITSETKVKDECLRNLVSTSDRLASLEQDLHHGWKKRFQNNADDIKSLKKSDSDGILGRLSQLEKSSGGWKNRVEKSDAHKFTSTHRVIYQQKTTEKKTLNKRNDEIRKETKKTVSSVAKTVESKIEKETQPKLPSASESFAPNEDVDDFFLRYEISKNSVSSSTKVDLCSFDDVTRNEESGRLFFRKNVPLARRQRVTANPIRALRKNPNVQKNQYKTDLTSLNDEKDRDKMTLFEESLTRFTMQYNVKATALRKVELITYQHPMLIQIKGRRRPIVKLVEPSAKSVNRGDEYILVNFNEVFHYQAEYSNVIERAVATEMASFIVNNKEFGISKTSSLVTINEQTIGKRKYSFWNALGGDEESEPEPAGSPEEDTIFESCLTRSNTIFEVTEKDLDLLEEFSGQVPKFSMLQPDKVFVLDFGSELYLWAGRNASTALREAGSKMLNNKWNEAFDANEFDICPISLNSQDKSVKRPSWGLCCKLTQNTETSLFKEKFSNWPPAVKRSKSTETTQSLCNFSPNDAMSCDVESMINFVPPEPNLILEMTHLGRGDFHQDEEDRRIFKIITKDLQMWQIKENEKKSLDENCRTYIYAESTYVIKWAYRVECMGRTLKGEASKHQSSGRDRTAYFFWQGAESSVSDKGACALMAVEVKEECGPQIRVPMFSEPPAFLNLFGGNLVIQSTTCREEGRPQRMFIVRGERETEAHLIEVELSASHFRPMACLLVMDVTVPVIYQWVGGGVNQRIFKICDHITHALQSNHSKDNIWQTDEPVTIIKCEQGSEPAEFKSIVPEVQEAVSVLPDRKSLIFEGYTPKFWKLEALSEEVQWIPVLSPYRHSAFYPYPLLQENLYETTQPALFLVDTGIRVWVWQGWWPEELEELFPTESALRHFLFMRLTAYSTAIEYAAFQTKRFKAELEKLGLNEIRPELVLGGHESSEFISIFPCWKDYVELKEISCPTEFENEEKVLVKDVYDKLSKQSYTLEELTALEKPEGVDQLCLEKYLNESDFERAFEMKRSEFYSLPFWKQLEFKKKCGLY